MTQRDNSDSPRRVWKFALLVEAYQVVPMPRGSSVLRVGSQGREPVLWAEVDPSAPMMDRVFYTYPTGAGSIAGDQEWIGTYQLPTTPEFVGHVYQEIR